MSIQSSTPRTPGADSLATVDNQTETAGLSARQTDLKQTPGMKPFGSIFAEVDLLGRRYGTPATPQDMAIDDGVTNARRAPSLYVPMTSLSAIDVMTQLSILSAQNSEETSAAVRSNILLTKDKLDQNIVTQQIKMKNATDKAIEAADSRKHSKVFGWITKVLAVVGSALAVVGAVAATVATGGAAVPLLAITGMAFLSATLSLADQISQECGGPEISISNGLQALTVSVLEAFGVPSEQAETISDYVLDFATPALLFVEPKLAGRLAGRICEASGASPETVAIVQAVADIVASVVACAVTVAATFVCTGGLSAVTSVMDTVLLLTGQLARVASGATQITQGGLDINTAVKERDATYIKAAVAQLKANSVELHRQMKNDQELLQTMMQSVQDGMQSASQVLRDVFDNLSQIMRNMSRRAPA